MEVMKSRSESPHSKNKSKTHSDVTENGDGVIDQIKPKKKSLRNKQKVHLNGKENGEPTNNDIGITKEDVPTSQKSENNENNENGYAKDNHENGDQSAEGIDSKVENNASVNTDSENTQDENVQKSEGKIETNSCNLDNDNGKENGNDTVMIETEGSAEKDTSSENHVSVESEIAKRDLEESTNEELPIDCNSSSQILDADYSTNEESSQNVSNCSNDDTQNKDSQVDNEEIIASSNTVEEEEKFFTNKVSNFIGKWTSTASSFSPSLPEKKFESEITSSKMLNNTGDDTPLIHPYLSKVSGRRGIRDRINSSISSMNLDEDKKTPKCSSDSLNDSFRVRTDPSKLLSSEMGENPTLRKFKGKRCLNSNDEPGDEENDFFGSSKRLRLDEKIESIQNPGLLRNILWSPFKNKPQENQTSFKLSDPESKLSRFLSPFWFWKKTTKGQKGQ